MNRVAVTIVTYNSREFIESCLQSVFRQTHQALEVVVIDNASTDGVEQVLAQFADRIQLVYNDRNIGFAAAQNQAISLSKGEWVLVLNPDVVLAPDFIEQLLDNVALEPTVGTVCGRLLSAARGLAVNGEPMIDTAGLYFTPAMRHFDRGWQERDNGRFRDVEYVFGASAAAALYRREMIDDISEKGEFFDPDFFAYREDADVAWRAQMFGWGCLYVPSASGRHVRSVGPTGRRRVPAIINMHSVKNRFLMRLKNMSGGLYRRYWATTTARDVLVICGCLLWEQRSLAAFWHIGRCLPRTLHRRRWIMSRRRVTDESLAHWFNTEPSSEPLPVRPPAATDVCFEGRRR